MTKSVSELVTRDMECEGLLECIHGLKSLDIECYEVVVGSDEPLTIDDIADEVGRERSTAYRAVRRLLEAGFVEKEQVNYDDGGYYHVYHPAEPDRVADEMRELIDDWHGMMHGLLEEYEEKYEDAVRA